MDPMTRNILMAVAASLIIAFVVIYTKPEHHSSMDVVTPTVPTLPWQPTPRPDPPHPPHPHPKPHPGRPPLFPKDSSFNVHTGPTKCANGLIQHIHSIFNRYVHDPRKSFADLCNELDKGVPTSCGDLRLRAIIPDGADTVWEFTNDGKKLKLPYPWPYCEGKQQSYPNGKTIWFRVNHQGFGRTFGLKYPKSATNRHRKWFPDYVKYF